MRKKVNIPPSKWTKKSLNLFINIPRSFLYSPFVFALLFCSAPTIEIMRTFYQYSRPFPSHIVGVGDCGVIISLVFGIYMVLLDYWQPRHVRTQLHSAEVTSKGTEAKWGGKGRKEGKEVVSCIWSRWQCIFPSSLPFPTSIPFSRPSSPTLLSFSFSPVSYFPLFLFPCLISFFHSIFYLPPFLFSSFIFYSQSFFLSLSSPTHLFLSSNSCFPLRSSLSSVCIMG